MSVSAETLIAKLGLLPHPEGGYYRETYHCPESVTDAELSVSFTGKRMLSTSIYFLITESDVSNFHRLQSDEIWYYHAGRSLSVYVIHPTGELEEIRLGMNLENGEVPQATVPRGTIFSSCVAPAALTDTTEQADYALVSCMVSPGFDFADFELFDRADLLRMYPQHQAIIERLTRP